MVANLLTYLQSIPWLNGGAGIGSMAFYVGLVIISQVILLPISPFDMAAGFAFGFNRGVAIVILSKVLSAFVSFNLARSVAKKPAQRLANRFPLLAGLNSAVAQGGWKLAALFRCCPIPFAIVSYAFGLSPLTNLQHVFSTGIAVIIPSIVFVSMGASAKEGLASLENGGHQNPWSKVVLVVGIGAAIFVIKYVSKIAMQSVKAAQTPPPPSTESLR